MSRFLFVLVAASLAGAGPATVIGASTNAVPYVEGEALVVFKAAVDLPGAERALRARGLGLARHFAGLSRLKGKQFGLVREKRRTTAALIADLQKDPAVETAEPNYIRHAFSSSEPNDPLFQQLWALQNKGQTLNGVPGTAGDDIRFLPAWALASTTSRRPVVAVIDSGVFYNHPDLSSNIWINTQEIPGNGIDDDGDGYVDNVYGYNFVSRTPDPTDSGEHGTHVSGTIAAVGDNGIGVHGVNPQAQIMALRVSNDGGETMPSSAIVEAIQYAVMMKQRGVNVVAINASFGGPGYSVTDRSAIQAAGDAGIVFCAAAGNDGQDNDATPTYPANYRLPNMLVVAATDQRDGLASFSNYGTTTVDLGAPGVNILSTVPQGMTSYVHTASSTFIADSVEFAGTTEGLTGQILDCGLGYPSNFSAQVLGNIALISRGVLYFSEKVSNAMTAGAVGVILYNNTNTPISATLQTAGDWIPAVMLSQADGLALKQQAPTTGTMYSGPDLSVLYQYLQGTSMATPHVAGAVSFAALNFPGDGLAQRIQRVLAAVDPVPALTGKVATGGRLNLLRIVDNNGNGLPDWWEKIYFPGVPALSNADPDGDGASNLQEFLAGTNPTNAASSLRLTISRGPGGNVLSWPGVGQSNVYLQRTSTPWLTNSWVDLFTNAPGNSGALMFTDAASLTNRTSYYRLRSQR